MLMPVALLITAVLVPYAIDQLRLQNAATSGHHSQNPHLFDMAWLVGVVMVLALVGALVREARGAFAWVAGCLGATGTAGLVFGEPVVLVRWRPGARDGGRSRRCRHTPQNEALTGCLVPTLRRMPAPTAASSTRWVGGASGVAVLAASASVLAVVLVLAGDVWDLPAAPQVLVDAAVGATCPVWQWSSPRPGTWLHGRSRACCSSAERRPLWPR